MSLLTFTEASKYALVILTLFWGGGGGALYRLRCTSGHKVNGPPKEKDQRDIYGLIPVPIAHPE